MTETSREIANAIAVHLPRCRHEARLSLSELAARSGVARATLHGLEKGRGGRVQFATLLDLARALDVPVTALLGRDLSRAGMTEAERQFMAAVLSSHRSLFPEAAR